MPLVATSALGENWLKFFSNVPADPVVTVSTLLWPVGDFSPPLPLPHAASNPAAATAAATVAIDRIRQCLVIADTLISAVVLRAYGAMSAGHGSKRLPRPCGLSGWTPRLAPPPGWRGSGSLPATGCRAVIEALYRLSVKHQEPHRESGTGYGETIVTGPANRAFRPGERPVCRRSTTARARSACGGSGGSPPGPAQVRNGAGRCWRGPSGPAGAPGNQ